MVTLRTEHGKHIVTHNGREFEFNTHRIALIFIKLIKEGAFECIST